MNNLSFSDGDFKVSDYLDLLEPSPKKGERNKYVCPNCGGHNLSISKDGIKYDCYNCGDKSAIAKILYRLKHGEPQYIPKQKKSEGKREFIYQFEGKPYIKVEITYGTDGKKRIYQSRYENGRWTKGLNDNFPQSKCELFKQDEVMSAIAQNKPIFIVEGEGCVESLRKLGFIATTNIGGSGKNYQAYQAIKDYPNIILCPDRDKKGYEHMESIEGMLTHKPKWLYVYPQSFWHNLPSSEGVDIAVLRQKLSPNKPQTGFI